ncbi:putative transposase [Gordonia amarae NBRC 15530]|uniref:Putative transposase n=1 Tax=Gordonia amarae NBRC 15530 TaxID=1075090 RepID=G7GUN3_9ACTN|nr:putative transposase [Gordonia amarae NBRC 15530]
MLVRTNSAGGTREFLDYLTDHHLEHSVGSGLWTTAAQVIDRPLPQVDSRLRPDRTERGGVDC